MTTEWLQAQLIAFSLEQGDSRERLAEKYARIILDRVHQNQEHDEGVLIRNAIERFYETPRLKPVETDI